MKKMKPHPTLKKNKKSPQDRIDKQFEQKVTMLIIKIYRDLLISNM
jgi:hypothetical protein